MRIGDTVEFTVTHKVGSGQNLQDLSSLTCVFRDGYGNEKSFAYPAGPSGGFYRDSLGTYKLQWQLAGQPGDWQMRVSTIAGQGGTTRGSAVSSFAVLAQWG